MPSAFRQAWNVVHALAPQRAERMPTPSPPCALHRASRRTDWRRLGAIGVARWSTIAAGE
jgi:hypothetical protein